MRFKAKLNDAKGLLGVLQVCRSIQRDCIIRLHPERTRVFSNVMMTDGVQVWMGCQSNVLFADMVCNSSNEEQSITCEVLDLAQLIHIVRQAELRERANPTAERVLMRLSKVGRRPLLKVSMDGVAGQPDLSFDVPLRILSDRDIQSIVPPPLPRHHLHLVVPDMPELTTFIDKLKNTAVVDVSFAARLLPSTRASTSAVDAVEEDENEDRDHRCRKRRRQKESPAYASLVVYAEHFMARFSLRYDAVELTERPVLADDEEEVDENGEPMGGDKDHGGSSLAEDRGVAAVTVEARTFARFFAAVKEIAPDRISMYVVHNVALVLSVHATRNNTTMVAYIPAKV